MNPSPSIPQLSRRTSPPALYAFSCRRLTNNFHPKRRSRFALSIAASNAKSERSAEESIGTGNPNNSSLDGNGSVINTRINNSSVNEDGSVRDTRIHYSSPDEGWIGTPSSSVRRARTGRTVDSGSDSSGGSESDESGISRLDRDMMYFVMEAADTHYKVLGLDPWVDQEGIKSAYRRLSKLYHPDTTNLPLELAAQQFVKLREAYTALSSTESRRLYDWQLAQDEASKVGTRYVWPYEADRTQRCAGSKPSKMGYSDTSGPEGAVDKPLSNQTYAALAFDLFALGVAILAIVYALYFKT